MFIISGVSSISLLSSAYFQCVEYNGDIYAVGGRHIADQPVHYSI